MGALFKGALIIGALNIGSLEYGVFLEKKLETCPLQLVLICAPKARRKFFRLFNRASSLFVFASCFSSEALDANKKQNTFLAVLCVVNKLPASLEHMFLSRHFSSTMMISKKKMF